MNNSDIFILTKYEKVRILGTRAEQLSNGSKPLVNINNLHNSLEIAEKELLEKKIPILIERKYPNGSSIILSIHNFVF